MLEPVSADPHYRIIIIAAAITPTISAASGTTDQQGCTSTPNENKGTDLIRAPLSSADLSAEQAGCIDDASGRQQPDRNQS
jgi:hypothetical protein